MVMVVETRFTIFLIKIIKVLLRNDNILVYNSLIEPKWVFHFSLFNSTVSMKNKESNLFPKYAKINVLIWVKIQIYYLWLQTRSRSLSRAENLGSVAKLPQDEKILIKKSINHSKLKPTRKYVHREQEAWPVGTMYRMTG